jgi:hypothetical protein
MPKPKGTPKTGGRQKGTPNKTSGDIKADIISFVAENLDDFRAHFSSLNKDQKFDAIMRLLPYVVPKQTEAKLEMGDHTLKNLQEAKDKISEMFSQKK